LALETRYRFVDADGACVRHLDDLALATLELALADIRELAALAARSQREAFDIVHERVNVNIDEVQRMLRSSERPPVTSKETPR